MSQKNWLKGSLKHNEGAFLLLMYQNKCKTCISLFILLFISYHWGVLCRQLSDSKANASYSVYMVKYFVRLYGVIEI